MLGAALAVAGCQHAAHPDEKSAVTSSLNSSNLNAVDVSQDREKGVMTLSGNRRYRQDLKNRGRVCIAKQAAPDYTIADEIGVRPPDATQAGSVASNLDSAIEDNFKASIKAYTTI